MGSCVLFGIGVGLIIIGRVNRARSADIRRPNRGSDIPARVRVLLVAGVKVRLVSGIRGLYTVVLLSRLYSAEDVSIRVAVLFKSVDDVKVPNGPVGGGRIVRPCVGCGGLIVIEMTVVAPFCGRVFSRIAPICSGGRLGSASEVCGPSAFAGVIV